MLSWSEVKQLQEERDALTAKLAEVEAEAGKMLAEADSEYNGKTNAMIARHAEVVGALKRRAEAAEAALERTCQRVEKLRLAVAEAYRKAVEVAKACERQNAPLVKTGFSKDYQHGLSSAGQAIAAAILALADTDDLAALEALRAKAQAAEKLAKVLPAYGFECDAGPLTSAQPWIDFVEAVNAKS